jgi:hypothetical protein
MPGPEEDGFASGLSPNLGIIIFVANLGGVYLMLETKSRRFLSILVPKLIGAML